MNYDRRITGQIIGRIRMQRGMTQEVLAGLAGMARSHLSLIESGRKSASVETLWRISSALNIQMSELVQYIEEEHRRRI